MGRIDRTPQARESLKQLGRYIAEQSGSLDIALRFLDRIEDRCRQFARSPLLGDLRDDLAPTCAVSMWETTLSFTGPSTTVFCCCWSYTLRETYRRSSAKSTGSGTVE